MTKSNLILGMGETDEEVVEALVQLHNAGCEIVDYPVPPPRSATTRSSAG